MNKMLTKGEKIYFIIMEIVVTLSFTFITIGIEKLKYEFNWVLALIAMWIQFNKYIFKED